jgi:hypothetical protein
MCQNLFKPLKISNFDVSGAYTTVTPDAKILYLQVGGTTFALHEDARRHFREHFKPTVGFNMPGFIRDTYVREENVAAVRRVLDKDYECVPWEGHVAVLGPRLNGHMAQLRKNRTLRDIVASSADGQHTIRHGSGREVDAEDREMLTSNVYGTPSLSTSGETRLE